MEAEVRLEGQAVLPTRPSAWPGRTRSPGLTVMLPVCMCA
jgi:hypothetical protein